MSEAKPIATTDRMGFASLNPSYELLPAGEVIVMDGGHHLHMEQPERIAQVIGDFFVRDCRT